MWWGSYDGAGQADEVLTHGPDLVTEAEQALSARASRSRAVRMVASRVAALYARLRRCGEII
jgi:hypothetical protein